MVVGSDKIADENHIYHTKARKESCIEKSVEISVVPEPASILWQQREQNILQEFQVNFDCILIAIEISMEMAL